MPSQQQLRITVLNRTRDANISAACQHPGDVKSLIRDFIEFKKEQDDAPVSKL